MVGKVLTGFMLVVVIMTTFQPRAHAVTSLIQSATAAGSSGTSQVVNFPATATVSNLIIIVCSTDTGTITGPSGYNTAIYTTGTYPQGVYYKTSAGNETTATCTFGTSARHAAQFFEYRGVVASSILDGTNTSTGSGTAVATGSVTTTTADVLLFAAVQSSARTSFSAWSNSFGELTDFDTGSGGPSARTTYGTAARVVSATGTYSTTATAGATGTWRGHIVAFKLLPPVLSVDIVNGSGVPIASPTHSMSATSIGFDCQSVSGSTTFFTSSQRLRITNNTAVATWSAAVAATSGATALWQSGGNNYDFNDTSGGVSGCSDGGDADTRAGKLAFDFSGASVVSAYGSCTTTGVSTGSSNGFQQGVVDSITLSTASSGASVNCAWDLTGISTSQMIPSEQPPGTYTLQLTVTVAAT